MNAIMPSENIKDVQHYRDRFPKILLALTCAILLLLFISFFVLYQVLHRPLPKFYARTPKGAILTLLPHDSPNLLPNTVLRWASKAAVAAYTFSFDPTTIAQQNALLRPYFTETGWNDYQISVKGIMETVIKNQLFVNSVVSDTPVISRQGDFGDGYIWEIQIPFLVTYQSSEETKRSRFLVIMTVVRVPASDNPVGIGINRFVMVTPS
ncbi:MAG: DotI/IcmL/TraM family protein [Gammaproteobacteria bacterium]|nr:DotI/IcmL/TraM family protein [Gammaproteobacteria bacterium]